MPIVGRLSLTPSPAFLAVASDLSDPASVTERGMDDQSVGSIDDTISIAKLSRVRKWPDLGPNNLMASFSCFYELQCTGNTWNVYGALSFQAQYRFTALMQRISNCGKIKNSVLTLTTGCFAIWYSGICRILLWGSARPWPDGPSGG